MNLTSNPIVNNYVTSFVIDKTSGVVVVPNTPLNYTYTNNTQPTFTYNITRDSEYLDHVDLIINNSLYGTSKSETCYQEDPTVANQTGIDTPNCGLKYTGVKVQGSPQGSMLYENYTKPAGATGATWRVSYGTTTLSAPPLPNEYVLPSACWSANANTTSVRVHIESGCGSTTSTQADCYNGTAWFTLQDKTSGTVTCTAGGSIGTVWDGNWSTGVFTSSSYTVWSTTTGPYFFEDAMIWNVPSSVTPNASLSTSTNYPWLFNYTETETQSVYSTETRSLYITGSGGGSGNVAQKSCIGFANGCSVSYTAGCGQ
jgi:hypothetical protein